MERIHIKGDTWYLDAPRATIPFYRLGDGAVVLLDSGSEGDTGIVEHFQAHGERVAAVLNSHGHLDHVHSNVPLREAFGAEIWMPKLEAAMQESLLGLKAEYDPINYHIIQQVFAHDLFSADHLIGVDQTSVTVGGATFRVIQTPGHSVSHVAFVTPDNVCYAGDVFSSPDLLSRARVLYTFCYAEDLKSKKRLAREQCDCFVVAHRGVFSDGAELARANIRYLYERVELMLKYMDRPMSREEIYRALFLGLGLHGGSPWKESNTVNMLGSLIEFLQTTRRVTTECRDGVFVYTKVPGAEQRDIESELLDL